MALCLESLQYRLENEEDGEMSFRLLDRLGVIPAAKKTSKLEEKVNDPAARLELEKSELELELEHETGVKDYIKKFVLAAYERGKVFGHPLPVLEGMETGLQECRLNALKELGK